MAAQAGGSDGALSARMAAALLGAGADPCARDLDGNTPYALACMKHGAGAGAATLLRAAAAAASGAALEPAPFTDPATLEAKRRRDQAAANARVVAMWAVPPLLREVFELERLFASSECAWLVERVEAFTEVQARPLPHSHTATQPHTYILSETVQARRPLLIRVSLRLLIQH